MCLRASDRKVQLLVQPIWGRFDSFVKGNAIKHSAGAQMIPSAALEKTLSHGTDGTEVHRNPMAS